MIIVMAEQDPSTHQSVPPMTTGNFIVTQTAGSATKAATAVFQTTDAQCVKINAQSAQAASGSVNLTSIGPNNAYAGTFDLVMDSGDHVTGSFGASGCSAVGSAISNNAPPNCI
jgi:hypothetical protein